MAHLTFLLPARERFGGQRLGETMARAMGRADRHQKEQGARAQLRRHVSLLPDHWPLAALTRRTDAGDAGQDCWLRADPAHIRPSINGATLLACGDALELAHDESEQMLRPLRPLFGDVGFQIDAPVPSHWYLKLPREAKVPVFPEPAQVLGADVFEHLPEGDEGRRWRALLSEAQVILHNHPVNARRASEGRLSVNSLWFWGAGVLPDHVSSRHDCVQSDDEVMIALAHDVARLEPLPSSFRSAEADTLVDLRQLRDVSDLERRWLLPVMQDATNGAVDALQLDFDDGHVMDLSRRQRWRFWRKPQARLVA